MKTLYIDVYFLINLTVDILALHFSSLFFHLPIRVWRLTLAGVGGAAFATAVLCSQNGFLVIFGKDDADIAVKASLPSEDAVDLFFVKFPDREEELLLNIIKVLGKKNLGIAKVILE